MLRAPELKDVDMIYRWENDPERLLHGRTGLPYSKDLITDYIKNYNDSALGSGQLRFIIEDSGEDTCGMADLYDMDLSSRKAFVSIYVASGSRGKGIANQSLDELIEFARDQLGLARLVAVVSVENEISRALFANKGFRELALLPRWVRGKNGTLTDAFLYDLSLDKER